MWRSAVQVCLGLHIDRQVNVPKAVLSLGLHIDRQVNVPKAVEEALDYHKGD